MMKITKNGIIENYIRTCMFKGTGSKESYYQNIYCVYQIPILAPFKVIFSHDFKIFHPSCIILIPIYWPYILQSNNEPSPMNYILAIDHNVWIICIKLTKNHQTSFCPVDSVTDCNCRFKSICSTQKCFVDNFLKIIQNFY